MALSKRVAKNSVFAFLAYAMNFFAARVSSVVIGRYLGPELNGVYQYLHSLAMTVYLLFTAPFTYTNITLIARAEGQSEPEKGNGYLKLSILIVQLGLLLLVGVVLAYPTSLNLVIRNPERYAPYLPLTGAILFPLLLSYTFSSGAQGKQQYSWISNGSFISMSLWMVLNFGVWLLDLGVQGFLATFFLQNLILCGVYFWYLGGAFFRPTLGGVSRQEAAEYLKTGASNFILFLSETILWQKTIEMVFLQRHVGEGELGFYSMGYNFSYSLMMVLPGVFWTVLFPVYAEKSALEDRDELQRIFSRSSKYLALLAMPLGFVGIALARPGITVLYGNDYLPVAWVFSVTIFGMMMYMMKMGLSSFFISTNKSWPLATMNFVAAGGMTYLLYRVIPSYGLTGAVFAKTGTQLLVAGIELVIILKLSRIEYPVPDVTKVLATSVLTMAVIYGGVLLLPEELSLLEALATCTAGGLLSIPLILLMSRLLGVFDEDDRKLLGKLSGRLPDAWRPLLRGII